MPNLVKHVGKYEARHATLILNRLFCRAVAWREKEAGEGGEGDKRQTTKSFCFYPSEPGAAVQCTERRMGGWI